MTPYEAAKKMARIFKLEWPIEIRLTSQELESMETEVDKHIFTLSPNTEETFLYELFARAKLAELYNEPLLSTLRFVKEDDRAKAFYQSSMPILTVLAHRVMRKCLPDEVYQRELHFVRELYEQGRQIQGEEGSPFLFFALYLALEDAGVEVGELPARSLALKDTLALFDIWLEGEPKVETLCTCYNYFITAGSPRAFLNSEKRIAFA